MKLLSDISQLFKDISLYWYTLKYLKPQQIVNRISRNVPRFIRKNYDAPTVRVSTCGWGRLSLKPQSIFEGDTFSFLNQSRSLGDIGWNGTQMPKLWRYNQHYFDDLNGAMSEQRSVWHYALLDNWCQNNPSPTGVGWEPYPCSLRIVNWIKWHLSLGKLSKVHIESLAAQTRHVSRMLEYHLLGNHLLANAKALVFGGCFFEGVEAEKWLSSGLAILQEELPEQILDDGGHFERSPMYHSIVLEDLFDLIHLSSVYSGFINERLVTNWRDYARQMLNWLIAMSHPDGDISFFNDAALDNALRPEKLIVYGKVLDVIPITHLFKFDRLSWLKSSGYVSVKYNNVKAILDLSPLGPDYLLGHGHADTLSFELSLFNQRLVVNSGTSTYDCGEIRLKERGTGAHSTVEVDGRNSSEIWSSFRVAHRAYPLMSQASKEGDRILVFGSHDGYQRSVTNGIHKRKWMFEEHALTITDRFTNSKLAAIGRVHFHPLVQVTRLGDQVWHAALPEGEVVIITVVQGIGGDARSTYAESFGSICERSVLEIELVQGFSEVRFEWANN